MTHYDVDYTGLTPQQSYDKSIEDIKEYLGEERYHKIVEELRTLNPGGLTMEQFEFAASLCGIQGFPVRAWHDYIFPYG